MSGFVSDYTAKKILDWIFGKVSYTPPATLYCALSTTTPAADGSNFTEPTGGGYARVAVANNTTNFPGAALEGSPAKETVHCAIDIVFPTSTASQGTFTWAGWFDDPTAGHMLDAGPLATPLDVLAANIQVKFPANTGFTGTQS